MSVTQNCLLKHARVAKLADAKDLKSIPTNLARFA
jgi:hypothetical protein